MFDFVVFFGLVFWPEIVGNLTVRGLEAGGGTKF